MCTKTKEERNKYSLKVKLFLTKLNLARMIEENKNKIISHCPSQGSVVEGTPSPWSGSLGATNSSLEG